MRGWMFGVGIAGWVVACAGPADDTDGVDSDETDTVDRETDSDAETDDTDPVETDDTPVETDTDPPGDPCLTTPAVIEFGTGESEFTAVTSGQMLRMVVGPQGGSHLTAAVRIHHSTELVRLAVTMTDVATGMSVNDNGLPHRQNVALVALAGGAWACDGEILHMQVRFDNAGLDGDLDTLPWDEMCGRQVLMRLDVSTGDNQPLGSAEHTVWVQQDDRVPVDNPNYRPDCTEIVLP